jgi:hypothetical protein
VRVKDLDLLKNDYNEVSRMVPFGSLPSIKKFVDILMVESECSACGSDMELSDSLKSLYCPNPLCRDKGVMRLKTMLADLKVRDMGEARCQKFLDYYNVNDPVSIFLYEPSDGPLFEGASMEFSEGVYDQIQEALEGIKLFEYIKVLNLPNIATSAYDIFAGYNTLDDFYADLHDSGVVLIQDLLGIKKDDLSIRALSIFETLMTFKKSIYLPVANGVIEFDETDYDASFETTTLTLYISTSAAPYGTKKDFLAYLARTFPHIEFIQKGLSMTLDFLITPPGTSKHTKALNMQDKGSAIEIMTASEFVKYLEENY